ncbi:MAG: nickel-type superoxide dismutase maturation protease [Rhodobacterales bacterium]|nr:nickel-type superoxide dismutase maturation protease [Rhodobacterales bacterium]
MRLALGQVELHRVSGQSMSPTLEEGMLVVLDPCAFQHRLPRPGEVVVAKHPYRSSLMVKRVVSIAPSGRVRLSGDNPSESTDSRSFGTIAWSQVRGLVVGHLGS